MNNGRRNQQKELKRQVERRKARVKRTLMVYIVWTVIVLAISISLFMDLRSQIREVKVSLEKIKSLQYESAAEVGVWEQEELTREIDYVSFAGLEEVEKPKDRSKYEVQVRLEELGITYPVIESISRDVSRYPETLLAALANNPEMADFVENYSNSNVDSHVSLTRFEKEQEYPLFLQWDPRWGYQSYGDNSIVGIAGCGPVCLSMALYYIKKDETLTPDKMAAYSMQNGYYVSGTGTSWALLQDVPELHGVKVTQPEIKERAMKKELDKGHIMICSMGSGDFTVAGHFIVVYGYDEKGFKVNDPNCVARSRKSWSFEEIGRQIKGIWSYS